MINCISPVTLQIVKSPYFYTSWSIDQLLAIHKCNEQLYLSPTYLAMWVAHSVDYQVNFKATFPTSPPRIAWAALRLQVIGVVNIEVI